MSCSSPFYVARGGEAKLTVNVQRQSGAITRVRVTYSANTVGIEVVPTAQEITLSGDTGSAEFTVRASPSTQDSKPFFYLYGQGFNNNSSNNQQQRSCNVQWTF